MDFVPSEGRLVLSRDGDEAAHQLNLNQLALLANAIIAARPSAPLCRLISPPRENTIIVGIPLMPKRAAISGKCSVSTFARRINGSRSRAADSNSGAIARHGPHHAAQKSTRTGSSVLPTIRSKSSAVLSSTGRPSNRGARQRPQFGRHPAVSRGSGALFRPPQLGQTIMTLLSKALHSVETWSTRSYRVAAHSRRRPLPAAHCRRALPGR
jgi:hypothetical protein